MYFPRMAGCGRTRPDTIRSARYHVHAVSGPLRGCSTCPRSGTCGMHTDARSARSHWAARSGSTRLSGRPLVIAARVPLVMERRKPVSR